MSQTLRSEVEHRVWLKGKVHHFASLAHGRGCLNDPAQSSSGLELTIFHAPGVAPPLTIITSRRRRRALPRFPALPCTYPSVLVVPPLAIVRAPLHCSHGCLCSERCAHADARRICVGVRLPGRVHQAVQGREEVQPLPPEEAPPVGHQPQAANLQRGAAARRGVACGLDPCSVNDGCPLGLASIFVCLSRLICKCGRVAWPCADAFGVGLSHSLYDVLLASSVSSAASLWTSSFALLCWVVRFFFSSSIALEVPRLG
eukprot:contig_23783_g5861